MTKKKPTSKARTMRRKRAGRARTHRVGQFREGRGLAAAFQSPDRYLITDAGGIELALEKIAPRWLKGIGHDEIRCIEVIGDPSDPVAFKLYPSGSPGPDAYHLLVRFGGGGRVKDISGVDPKRHTRLLRRRLNPEFDAGTLETRTRRRSGYSTYWIAPGPMGRGFVLVADGREIAGPYPTLEIAENALNRLAPRQNPRITRHTMVGRGGEVVEPVSEGDELTFAIELLQGAFDHAGTEHDVDMVIRVLRKLRDQVSRGFHRNPRRPNPTLAIVGANPPGGKIRANWGRIEYRRPDDPEGKRVVREHEFPDGFVACGLADGSVLLRHPSGRRLWTRR